MPKYLVELLDYAVEPKVDSDTAERLFRLLRYRLQQEHAHPTPRRIIDFVNELGALWPEWGDKIALETLAIYNFHRETIESDPDALLNPQLIDQRYRRISNAANLQRDLAALIFNVEPELANQVNLREPISRALVSDDPKQLVKLSQIEGFAEVLPDVLEADISEGTIANPTHLSDASKNINALDLSGELSRTTWSQLGEAISSIDNIELSDRDKYEGLLLIIQYQSDDDVIYTAKTLRKKFFESIKAEVDHHSDGEEWLLEGENWQSAISRLLEVLHSKSDDAAQKAFLESTELPGNTQVRIGAAHACAINSKFEFSRLIHQNKEDTFEEYGKLIEDSADCFFECLCAFDPILDDNQRGNFLNKISSRLQSGAIKEDSERLSLLNSFAHLFSASTSHAPSKKALTKVANDGTLLIMGKAANDNKAYKELGIIQWLIISSQGNATASVQDQHPNLGGTGAAVNWYADSISKNELQKPQIKELTRLVLLSKGFSRWAEYAIKDRSKNEFFRTIFKRVIESGKFKSLEVENTVYKYQEIKYIIGDDLSVKFIEKFSEWSGHFDKKIHDESVLKIPDAFLIDACNSEVRGKYTPIFENLDKYLKSLPQDKWEESLTNESDALRLLLIRRKTGNLIIPVANFRPALFTHALKVLQGELLPKTYHKEWGEVVNALAGATRTVLARDIFNKLETTSVNENGAENYVTLYGELASKMPFATAPGIALDQFFSKIVFLPSEEVKLFIREQSNSLKKCVKNADEGPRENFEAAIKSLEEKDDESVSAWATELRKLSGLNRQGKSDRAADQEER